jgi:hypothetical protein
MAKFTMSVKGGDALMNMFKRAPQVMAIEAAKIIYETAVEIENKAKNKVKVDTGALRTSIRATKLSDGSSMVKAGASNVSNSKGHLINYAAFVEFGTGRAPNLSYNRLDNKSLLVYAGEFKGKGIKRFVREPSPYLFNSANELLGKMANRIKNIKI